MVLLRIICTDGVQSPSVELFGPAIKRLVYAIDITCLGQIRSVSWVDRLQTAHQITKRHRDAVPYSAASEGPIAAKTVSPQSNANSSCEGENCYFAKVHRRPPTESTGIAHRGDAAVNMPH